MCVKHIKVCEAHQDRELEEWHGQMRRFLPSATRIESRAELDLWDFSVDAFLDGRISINSRGGHRCNFWKFMGSLKLDENFALVSLLLYIIRYRYRLTRV
jgi:hypothetical protein